MTGLKPAVALAKALAVRAGPGLINLLSLMLVAKALDVTPYGLFSTTVATAGLIANCIFGIGNLSVVAQYASHAGRRREAIFVWTLFALWGAMAVSAIIVGWVSSLWIALAWPTLALVVVTSLRALLQEIVRARQAIGIYGLSDLIQALVFLCLVFTAATPATSPTTVILWLAMSNAVAMVVHPLHLRRLVAPHRPSWAMMRKVVGMGRWLVLTNLTENFLYTGARYLILARAGPQALGVFSLAVDFAQRTVSFIVNAASFVHVPRAFAIRVKQGDLAFIRVLREAAIVAAIAAVLAMSSVVLILMSPMAEAYVPDAFDILVFVIVAWATTINRIKKLALEPIAIIRGMSNRLLLPNIIGAIAGLAAIAVATHLGDIFTISAGYLFGYAINTASLAIILNLMPKNIHKIRLTRRQFNIL